MISPKRQDASGKAAGEPEFGLADAEFERIAALVFDTCGIVLKAHKRQMIYTRLARRLRALGLTTFTDYLDHLQGPSGAGERQEFVNAVTTNLTSFFREGHHFEHLRGVVLERAVARRGRLRIWSAGCSTGEEPYTIALAANAARAPDRCELRILATDLDTRVLAKAQTGVYAADRTADLPADLRAGVRRLPDGDVQVDPRLRGLIAFRRLNLLHEWPFSGPFDAIFCRNVLIYFDAATKARLVERFARLLTDDGFLYLGHSESLLGEHPLLSSEGRTIYRRRP